MQESCLLVLLTYYVIIVWQLQATPKKPKAVQPPASPLDLREVAESDQQPEQSAGAAEHEAAPATSAIVPEAAADPGHLIGSTGSGSVSAAEIEAAHEAAAAALARLTYIEVLAAC